MAHWIAGVDWDPDRSIIYIHKNKIPFNIKKTEKEKTIPLWICKELLIIQKTRNGSDPLHKRPVVRKNLQLMQHNIDVNNIFLKTQSSNF